MTQEQQNLVRYLADFYLAMVEQEKLQPQLNEAKGNRELESLLLERVDKAIQKRKIADDVLRENLSAVQFLRTEIITRKAI